MKFTYDWLNHYVDTEGLTPADLADKLTMLGLEVDSLTSPFSALSGLKTATVTSCKRHPDADKLSLCQVKIGDENLQIVCGAPNVREGLSVVVALPGTVLPGNFKIGKSKIRGEHSYGMICSEKELGLSNEHQGIMELPEGTKDGLECIEALGLDSLCIDVDLTPNRPDCASVIGIAREVSSFVNKPLRLPVDGAKIVEEDKGFTVRIEAPDLCPRYAGKRIQNVKIGPSPWWLRRILISVGLRPINNVVDVTNFVMLEYGQPLHAFDFKKLAEGRVVVRRARADEKSFTTLDGVARQLDEETLLICDGRQPVAVAGVMGGLDSEVSAETTEILLESACFDQVSIRRSARRLKLSTDSSYRFERGVDPEGTINALERAAQLICELAGGVAVADGIDRFPGKRSAAPISLSVARTNTLLGINLSADEIAALLQSIKIVCSKQDEDRLLATVPSFRRDLFREADLVEEVARLFGYNRIPTSLPKLNLSYPEQDPERSKRLLLSSLLPGIGFTEVINYSFIGASQLLMLGIQGDDERLQYVELINPLSEDQGIMRTTLLPGLLENVKRNINFQRPAIKLFELGKVFFKTADDTLPRERHHLSGVLSGNRYGNGSPLYYKQADVDIFDAKGCVAFILEAMNLSFNTRGALLHFTAIADDQLEPFAVPGSSLGLFLQSTKIGSVERIKESVLRSFGIKNAVYYFDLDFDSLCRLQTEQAAFRPLPIFPFVKRDIALLVKEDVSAGQILETVTGSDEKLIEQVEIFDVFQGGKVPEGHKSIGLTVTYRSATKTLTEKNVDKSHAKVVHILTEKFGGSFRDA